nr:unnamed protein product [Digitaria exilis]
MATTGWAPARSVERHGAPRGGGMRSKSVAPVPRRPSPSPARSRPAPENGGSTDSCRVRVAVRVRPKNSEELAHDADFDSCVELQPESKRLKLKKNNWSCESYKFDEVFSENASQKRVYEVVAKPVAMKVVNTIKLKEEVDYENLYKKMEREVDQLTSEMERQQKLIKSEKILVDKKLKETERSFHDLRVTSSMQIEEVIYEELKSTQEKVQQEIWQRQGLEDQILRLKQTTSDNYAEESKTSCGMVRSGSGLGNAAFVSKSGKLRETGTISKIFEEVGLPNVLALLKSEDLDVQIHAVKVVANLAAEGPEFAPYINQERIVEEGGLDALLSLLETSENTTIHRVTAGAIANLAMNGLNQGVIMSKGGARLLANVASKTDDPQTLRMVADGNTCDIIASGGIKELLRISRESPREDARNLAKKALDSNPAFLKEVQ